MVAIVIVNYNGSFDTLACVNSIIISSYNHYRIIVVDNNSKNEDIENLETNQSDKFILIKNKHNDGFAKGNNIGIDYAIQNIKDLEYIWLLNNDTIIFKDTLSKLVNYIKNTEKSVGMIGHKMLFLDNPSKIQAVGGIYNKYLCRCFHLGAYETDMGQYDKVNIKFDYIVGASMFVKREFIEDVGLMSEEYFLYFEELDWILRGRKKGWKFAYAPNISILHKEGGSTKSRSELNENIGAIQLCSRMTFTKKFHPSVYPLVIIAIIGMITKYYLKGKFRYANSLLKSFLDNI